MSPTKSNVYMYIFTVSHLKLEAKEIPTPRARTTNSPGVVCRDGSCQTDNLEFFPNRKLEGEPASENDERFF